MPKRCPRCGSRNIIDMSGRYWRCRNCGHRWEARRRKKR